MLALLTEHLASTDGGEVRNWLDTTAVSALAGAVIYLAKTLGDGFLSGRIVHRDSKAESDALKDIIDSQGRMAEQCAAMAAASAKREDQLTSLISELLELRGDAKK